MSVRGGFACSAVFAVAVLAGCAGPETPAPAPSVSPVSSVLPPAQTLAPTQQRYERIRGMLYTVGCASNSCVQTYFACMDGYLTGDPCQLYRDNPPPP
ncbi:hypothetical protein BOX37_30765 [Nocardia mangyaensis]|uniref:Lipoprotein n=1 Tax=Nocardia mangyaensis TaxID=2213200 RepID=A0A1J0VZY0_9NOCA|nr:hypothetical protein [Nocardia mangyaensis]APE37586.1 hypothetical protein BOX37_30765 [Nocardia mangyaensis]